MSIEGFNGEENYYPPPTSNKHKGDVMERRDEWYVDSLSSGDATIRSRIGRWVGQVRADIAEQIVTDHNQHTTLVKQRDLLAAVARAVVKKYEGNFAVPFEDAELLDMAMNALATVEQGHEEQAGGGSGDLRSD